MMVLFFENSLELRAVNYCRKKGDVLHDSEYASELNIH